MKPSILTLLFISIFTISCGDFSENYSTSSSFDEIPAFDSSPMSISPIAPISTEITNITKNLADIPEMKFTRISMKFDLYCHHDLQPISHHIVKGKEQSTIYISVFESISKLAVLSNCITNTETVRMIDIPGEYSKDELKIVFNKAAHKSIQMRTTKIFKTKDINLTSVDTKDCNDHPSCFVSSVTLHIGTSGCLDDAFASYSYEIEENKVKLYVSALNIGNIKSKGVRCFAQNKVPVKIMLPVKTKNENIQLIKY